MPCRDHKKALANFRRCFFLIYKELDIGKESRPSENIWPLGLHNPNYYGGRLSLYHQHRLTTAYRRQVVPHHIAQNHLSPYLSVWMS